MSATENILIRGVNWLGDAVMTTPALQRLREAKPNARITLLTTDKLADLWQGQPYLDEIITFAKNESVFSVARRLSEKNFTAGIAFPNSIRSALEMWLAKIPQRIGFGRPIRSLFLTQAMALPPGARTMHKRTEAEIKQLIADNAPPQVIPATAHQTHHYLHLVTALGASAEPISPRLAVNDADVEALRARLGSGPWFGLNPGAEYGPAKRWPAEYFITAANELSKQTNCRWLVFGAAANRELTEKIAQAIQGTNLAGQTSLRELAAALKLCRVLISNDTGPTHLAAALGTPVVVPYGSTSPEMTGPFLGTNAQIIRSSVPCSPCFLRECPIDFRCLKGIEPAQVVNAAMKTLSLILLLCLFVLPIQAAREKKKPIATALLKFDTNKNGTLDSDELDALKKDYADNKTDALKKYDTNNNGKIDENEVDAIKTDFAAAVKAHKKKKKE